MNFDVFRVNILGLKGKLIKNGLTFYGRKIQCVKEYKLAICTLRESIQYIINKLSFQCGQASFRWLIY